MLPAALDGAQECWTGLGLVSWPLRWPVICHLTVLLTCKAVCGFLFGAATCAERQQCYVAVVEVYDWATLMSRVWQLESWTLQCPRHACCKQTSHPAQRCPFWHCSYKRIASDPKINHFFEGEPSQGKPWSVSQGSASNVQPRWLGRSPAVQCHDVHLWQPEYPSFSAGVDMRKLARKQASLAAAWKALLHRISAGP